jgi:cell volume regulation protein A
MVDPVNFLVFSSTIILVGYFSNLIFRRTGIPDLLSLLFFGLIIGPGLNIVNRAQFIEIAPIVSVITIILITFEAGTDIDYETLKEIFPITFKLSLITFLLITLGTGFVLPLIFPLLSHMESLLVGTFLGGLSTVSVLSIMNKFSQVIDNVSRSTQILFLESTIIDPIRVMSAITIINIIQNSQVLPRDIINNLFFVFLFGSIIGVITGIVWTRILHRLRNHPYNYMITLAILLQVYFLSELFAGEGGGTMACFTFGFVLANHNMIGKKLGYRAFINIKRLVEVNDEISFVLKSYYFIFIGIIASISFNYLMIGLILTVLIVFLRYVSAIITRWVTDLGSNDFQIISLLYPLGTSSFVLAQISQLYDPQGIVLRNSEIYTSIVFPVALGTILFSAVIAPRILRVRNNQ